MVELVLLKGIFCGYVDFLRVSGFAVRDSFGKGHRGWRVFREKGALCKRVLQGEEGFEAREGEGTSSGHGRRGKRDVRVGIRIKLELARGGGELYCHHTKGLFDGEWSGGISKLIV